MLYDKAHKNRARSVRDDDLVRRFLDGLLDQEAKFEVEYHKEPKNIDEAVFHVVNLIQMKSGYRYDRQNRQKTRRTLNSDDRGSHYDCQSQEPGLITRLPQARADAHTDVNQKKMARRDTPKSSDQSDLIKVLQMRVEKLESAQSSSQSTQVTNSQVQCYTCKEHGHYARECPRKENGDSGFGHDRKGKCFSCGEVGHFSRECPKRVKTKRNLDQQQGTSSIPQHHLNFQGPSLAARERSD